MPFGVQSKKHDKRLRVSLEDTLLNPVLLQDEIVAENALCVLEGHLENATVDQESLINCILDVPNLFAFAFSSESQIISEGLWYSQLALQGISKRVAASTSAYIISHFPSHAASFEGSIASSLLWELSQYFLPHKHLLASLRECYQVVDLARPALKTLASMTFFDNPRSALHSQEPDEFEGLFVGKHPRKHATKRIKHNAAQTSPADLRVFERLDINVPRSKEEAAKVEQQILDDQKDILAVSDLFIFPFCH
jgi:hypothetical protein